MTSAPSHCITLVFPDGTPLVVSGKVVPPKKARKTSRTSIPTSLLPPHLHGRSAQVTAVLPWAYSEASPAVGSINVTLNSNQNAQISLGTDLASISGVELVHEMGSPVLWLNPPHADRRGRVRPPQDVADAAPEGLCLSCGAFFPSQTEKEIHIGVAHGLALAKDIINTLPVWQSETPVMVCNSEQDMEDAVAAILEEAAAVELLHVGFDTEWAPQFTKGQPQNPTALIQMATQTMVYLFPVAYIGTIHPLIPVLEDPRILKWAAGPDEDVRRLFQYASFTPAGFSDICQPAKARGYSSPSLRTLTALILSARLTKAQQMSNWAAWPLTPAQVRYAAADAVVSLLLGQHFYS